jgi:cysteinyl-tRNA synthetase
MNDKDKEAFEKWYIKTDTIPVINNLTGPRTYNYFTLEQTWQAACEYKQKEIDTLKLEYDKLTDWAAEYKAENKKLREALEFYAEYKNDDPDDDYNYDVAREALKEVEKK